MSIKPGSSVRPGEVDAARTPVPVHAAAAAAGADR
jgi:hypothetical protein